jgi:diguanylate cyclase (GGDEF)-like protein
MITTIQHFIEEMTGIRIHIVRKKDFIYRKGQKFFPINNLYILTYEQNAEISIKTLHRIKIYLNEFFSKYEQKMNDLEKLKILQKELEAFLRASKTFFSIDQGLEKSFSFIYNEALSFALIENNKTVINKNMDPFTIKSTLGKLQKYDTIDLPVRNGELFATKKEWYTAILFKKGKISPFAKQVIKSKLVWLGSLYESKKHYEIDKLTGLYTRERFLSDIKKTDKISHSVFVNLKEFKTLNQIYSSTIGDNILKETAKRLRRHLPETMKIYRVYGDRFAITIPEKSNLSSFANRLRDILASPLTIDDTSGLSKGEIAVVSPDPQIAYFENIPDEILEKANYVFRKSKNDITDFENEIKMIMQKEDRYFNILLRVLENDGNGIIPFFQKVTNNSTGEVVYYEALMRIRHKNTIMDPAIFLRVAKDRGYYKKLNFTMIKKSIEAIPILKQRVSINIDIFDVLQNDFRDFIIEIASKNGVNGDMIQLELLETEDIYTYYSQVKNFIEGMKKFGCRIALDDFGKGYSNFSNIMDLPLDVLKIDMSLIENIDKKQKKYNILQAIIHLSKILKMETTVEGIENETIYNRIKHLPIDNVQGFYFNKPKPLTEITNLSIPSI